jgi:hypothetical protein
MPLFFQAILGDAASVHLGRAQVRRFAAFGRRRRRPLRPASEITAPRVHRTGGVLHDGVRVVPVHVFVHVVGAVVLLHPVRDVVLLVVGQQHRRIPETEDLVGRRRRFQLALLRHLPLLPHHSLQVLEEVYRRFDELLRTGELRGVGALRRRWLFRQRGHLLGHQVETDLLGGLFRTGCVLEVDFSLRMRRLRAHVPRNSVHGVTGRTGTVGGGDAVRGNLSR